MLLDQARQCAFAGANDGRGVMAEQADVLVVGLGPAGASAARAAAAAGCKVIAIDRKQRAGHPVQCAEFVPSMLSPTIDAVTATRCQPIRAMQTFVENEEPDWQGHFPGVMVDRAAFDAHLVESAREAGAECRFDAGLAMMTTDGTACVHDGSLIRADVIVGADGPRSRVGKAIGQVNRELVAARQVTVPLSVPHQATDIFLSADYPGGYGWLFPRGEVANLGIGVNLAARDCLKAALEALRQSLVREGRIGDSIGATTGGSIPVGGMLEPIGHLEQRVVLLAGDAAGLTNPVTGAGISAAVMSGTLAGEAAAGLRSGDAEARTDYAEELNDLFGAAIDRAQRRRREVLGSYRCGGTPGEQELRGGWIAYPDYWAA